MRRLMLSRVARFISVPPWLSRLMLTCGRPFSSKLDVAPVTRSPPMIRSRSSQALRSPERWSRNSNCSLSELAASGRASRRNSRLAVLPRMRLASAVSCTPGSSTTMRLRPCFWIIGSATPSSLTRLRSVVRFWLTA